MKIFATDVHVGLYLKAAFDSFPTRPRLWLNPSLPYFSFGSPQSRSTAFSISARCNVLVKLNECNLFANIDQALQLYLRFASIYLEPPPDSG